MNAIVAFAFLAILGLLLFSISFGLGFYEKQRRRKLVSMLRTVTQDGEEQHVDLLIDMTDQKKSGDRSGDKDKVDFLAGIEKMLHESGLGWSMSRLGATMGVTFLIGAVVSMFIKVDSPPALRALLVGGCASMIPVFFVSKKRASRLAQLEALLPDALDFLARSMRAGHAFTISLEMVGEEIQDPLGHELRTLFNEQNLGASMERSFAGFARRVPIPDVRYFCSAVLLQRQTGGNLSEILNRLSHIIRERFRLKGQVKAVSAHGRLTAIILTLLPIVTLGGLMLTSPGYLDPMFQSAMGKKILGLGVLAQIMGNLFIRKIIRIKV